MIPVNRAHLYVAATTHPGRKGKKNEDRYAVSAYRLSERDPNPALLAIVADGVGGHRAGEVAAEMAVEMISGIVSESDASEPLLTLEEAIMRASQAIYARSAADPAQQGMSTTCACALVIGDRLFIASVGDSRIYLVRGDTIRQLTTDHTWVQEVIASGDLSPEQARLHPNAHVIRRHLGSQQPVVPDLRLRLKPEESDMQAEANQGLRLRPGDRLLLCSDGLTDLVEQEEILEVLATQDKDKALDALVDLANTRGGHDNITIVTLQAPRWERQASGAALQRRRTALVWTFLGVAALLLMGIAGLSGLAWIQSRVTPTLTANQTLILGITSDPVLLPTVSPTQDNLAQTTPAPTPTIPQTPDLSPSPTRPLATYTAWPTSTLDQPLVTPPILP